MIQWMLNHRKLLDSAYTPLYSLEVLFPATDLELYSIKKENKASKVLTDTFFLRVSF